MYKINILTSLIWKMATPQRRAKCRHIHVLCAWIKHPFQIKIKLLLFPFRQSSPSRCWSHLSQSWQQKGHSYCTVAAIGETIGIRTVWSFIFATGVIHCLNPWTVNRWNSASLHNRNLTRGKLPRVWQKIAETSTICRDYSKEPWSTFYYKFLEE